VSGMPESAAHEPAPHRKVAAFDAGMLLREPAHDPAMRRPITTTVGAALVLLSVLAGLVWLVEVVLLWRQPGSDVDVVIEGVSTSERDLALIVLIAIVGAALLVELVLAVFIFLGFNWARVAVLTFSAISICSAFAAWWAQGKSLTIDSTLWSVALDILVLLALSSRRAATYARRNERRSSHADP